MNALDFEYDGLFLSDFGLIICDFDYSDGFVTASAGSKIDFTKTSANYGRHWSLHSSKYGECLTTTFGICKNPDLFSGQDIFLSDNKIRAIMRWLNRGEFCNLIFHYLDERDARIFHASFNIEKVCVGANIVGLQLTMETDAPYGYAEEQVIDQIISDTSKPFVIRDSSDELGYCYPYVKIKCLESGTLTLRNALTGSYTVVNNCTANETITMSGDSLIVSSTNSAHDIANDFNYDFFKLGNTISNRDNQIYSSLKCEIEVRYSPVIKCSI